MAKWKCPKVGCNIWALAPDTRPVHELAHNPNFQAKDPHCPVHHVDLVWTADETAAQDDPDAPIPGMGMRDAMMGIKVGQFGQIPIYCDYHQRKHISGGNWPGDVPQDKPLFLADLFNQKNLRVGALMAKTVPWGTCRDKGGVDIIFDCGTFVVGTDKETEILLQGGFNSFKGGEVIAFHAYPIKNEGTQAKAFKTCKLNNRIFRLQL
jgi:hypothetical protein